MRKKFAKSTAKLLKGTISKIEKPKYGKKYNLYLDGVLAFSVFEETILKFNLRNQKVLQEKETQAILEFDQKNRALNQAYNLLGIRPRSQKEMQERLEKNYSSEIVQELLTKLEEKKLLSDRDFTKFWLSASKYKLKSKKQIQYELYQKKVPEEEIQKALGEISDEEEITKAKRLAEKIQARYQDLSEFSRKQKLQNYLARRGFTWEIIHQAIQK